MRIDPQKVKCWRRMKVITDVFILFMKFVFIYFVSWLDSSPHRFTNHSARQFGQASQRDRGKQVWGNSGAWKYRPYSRDKDSFRADRVCGLHESYEPADHVLRERSSRLRLMPCEAEGMSVVQIRQVVPCARLGSDSRRAESSRRQVPARGMRRRV